MEKLALFGGEAVLKKPLQPYNSIGKEEKEAATKVMDRKVLSDFVGLSGKFFLGGKYVKSLEQNFCKYFGVKYAVSFNSASTALQAAVGALGIGPGDEVITSPYTMSATASAVLLNNALPVFADIKNDDFCLDYKSIEALINKNTKAILSVNIFGGSADYRKILALAKKNKLKVIEDNAQSPGATYYKKFSGTIGDIGVFSFNVHKVIQAGEGGVLVTNNKKYAFRAQLIRNHGEAVINDLNKSEKIYEPVLGNNYRITELQAAIAVEQLKKLKKLNRERILLANYLTGKLKKFSWLSGCKNNPGVTHVYYIYPIRFLEEKVGIKRSTFVKAMKAEGFNFNEGYQEPLYLFPMYQRKQIYPNSNFPFVSKEFSNNANYNRGICPVAEKMYEKEMLCTNICQPPQTKREIDLFIRAIEKIEENVNILKKHGKKE